MALSSARRTLEQSILESDVVRLHIDSEVNKAFVSKRDANDTAAWLELEVNKHVLAYLKAQWGIVVILFGLFAAILGYVGIEGGKLGDRLKIADTKIDAAETQLREMEQQRKFLDGYAEVLKGTAQLLQTQTKMLGDETKGLGAKVSSVNQSVGAVEVLVQEKIARIDKKVAEKEEKVDSIQAIWQGKLDGFHNSWTTRLEGQAKRNDADSRDAIERLRKSTDVFLAEWGNRVNREVLAPWEKTARKKVDEWKSGAERTSAEVNAIKLDAEAFKVATLSAETAAAAASARAVAAANSVVDSKAVIDDALAKVTKAATELQNSKPVIPITNVSANGSNNRLLENNKEGTFSGREFSEIKLEIPDNQRDGGDGQVEPVSRKILVNVKVKSPLGSFEGPIEIDLSQTDKKRIGETPFYLAVPSKMAKADEKPVEWKIRKGRWVLMSVNFVLSVGTI